MMPSLSVEGDVCGCSGRGHAAADRAGDVPAGLEEGRQCVQLSGGRQVSLRLVL